ncbi:MULTISPECIES: phosphoribosylamine--glycine ligase [Methanothermobacter]|uniref:phosphoribosylamine--glycine ligase n=1 Tax=Methanothermobacter TaxID=145260 RepID=UPI0002CD0057|nr:MULTISPECIES: phosphoribosylamine--glycine ligase [Methanothermobacter]MDK2874239.1 phosphoribosylamine---glycine ligase [Methanothermobacter sp.]MDI6818187.1 phosphoribosylamine--glycine ligase [Methanothermobacter thermautotrophicus]MDN5373430.1 phosphoribosylamine---glycine ligase [Methanothermobacter sp.]WBF05958.1 phosphoribosylamine--glycine ligase [Methanothermobacter thermautotrophicus]WBF07750.1 phosphoribosylamine--glycine ligase [Methanothermobacter thermautotrophicus]
MKILVVGTGAREHAICSALADEATIYSVMGNRNPGISRLAREFTVAPEVDTEGVVRFASEKGVDMAFIGPEAPLEAGLVDALEEAGIPSVGPTRDAARIETDKSFMRKLFEDYRIPGSITYRVFSDPEELREFMEDFDSEAVVKPVGLTGGKGVKIVGEHLRDNMEALKYATEVIEKRIGGHPSVVIEERVVGEEFTVQAFSDGEHIVPMPAVQDHPHAYEGDQGPITGGMGSYSDSDGLLPFLTQKDYEDAVEIMQRTVDAIRKETGPYRGILYGQFMLSADGPKLIEYNARFGDPEAMNVLPLLESSMLEICEGIVDGNLKSASFMNLATVCKYLVPEGYPESGVAGAEIKVDEKKIEDMGVITYYAAVNQEDDHIYTSSSRALALVAPADDIYSAEELCEEATAHVKGRLYHRRDIGTRELVEKRIKHMEDLRS